MIGGPSGFPIRSGPVFTTRREETQPALDDKVRKASERDRGQGMGAWFTFRERRRDGILGRPLLKPFYAERPESGDCFREEVEWDIVNP